MTRINSLGSIALAFWGLALVVVVFMVAPQWVAISLCVAIAAIAILGKIIPSVYRRIKMNGAVWKSRAKTALKVGAILLILVAFLFAFWQTVMIISVVVTFAALLATLIYCAYRLIKKWTAKSRARSISFDDAEVEVFVEDVSLAKSIDQRVSDKVFGAFGNVQWRWYYKPERFYQRGGIARVEMLGAPYRFADIHMYGEGCLALHAAVEINCAATMPTAEVPKPTVSESVVAPVAPVTSEPVAPPPIEKPTHAISLFSPEGVEKWFNIVFHGSLKELADNLHTQGHLSLHIFKDGKAFTVGSNEQVFDFGEIPDEIYWDMIFEKLAIDGLFAEERDGSIFVSWS